MASSPETTFLQSVRGMKPVVAPPEQRQGVVDLARVLKPASAESADYKLVSPSGEVTQLPQSVFFLLEHITEVLARGDAITVVPVGSELTTQKAADLLNVSRQYVVRLLDEGRIPFHRIGTHRRIRMSDLLAFRRRRDHDRALALDELSALSQEFGGYEEIASDD